MEEIAEKTPNKFCDFIWMLGACGNINYVTQ